MKTIRNGFLTVVCCVIVTSGLQCECSARSTALANDEQELLNAVRERIRLKIFYSRWSQSDEVVYPFPLDKLKLVNPAKLPKVGTYWSRQRCTAPLPFNPFTQVNKGIDVDVYELPDGTFLLDDMEVDYEALQQARQPSGMALMEMEGGESGEGQTSSLRTAEQFAAQTFSLIDTNDAALNDTNLYNACVSFPDNTNTFPTLQIAKYGTNAVIIKANHFDYSSETERDFALLVCDSVDKPLWKSIDFGGAAFTQDDGWLIQGTVPNWQVTDPMYLAVSNITDRAFFRAIPYGGPEIQLTGMQPFDTVSNTITLQAVITDLSGVTNEQFEVTVDGNPARYTLGTNNTISINTKYNPNGPATVYLKAINNARVYDPVNPPDNSKLYFTGTGSLPLDFENDTYLLWASDYCPPDVGTNYFYFVTDRPQTITASIYDPSDGHVVKSFAGYVPYPATISLSWNFTEANGVTPYTNGTYAVDVQTSNSTTTTLTFTNTIDREGVRPGAGCFMTYQWEDPGDPSGVGPYLNSEAETWIQQALTTLYKDLYKPNGPLTQYTTSQVGTNRNYGECIPYDSWSLGWDYILPRPLSNSFAFSDLTIAQAHGSGAAIGGGGFLNDTFEPLDLKRWAIHCMDKQNWRLRKAALWTCYSGSLLLTTAGGNYPSWFDACGIRPGGLQEVSFMRKNCGLFFGGRLEQQNFGGNPATVTAKVAEFLDQAWVCGQFQWPGARDPTYSFRFAVNATRGEFNPQMDKGNPLLAGYRKMIYSSVYDDELMMLDTTHVKDP